LVAALAEAEVMALRDRTIAGLRNARAKGKRLGRPLTGEADVGQMLTLKAAGMRQHQIAERLKVSRAYVSRKLALHKSGLKSAL
jgi:DNA invertase Pin-like site-specific DNA recombinase